jgi:filamentous hemagglutinin family protein
MLSTLPPSASRRLRRLLSLSSALGTSLVLGMSGAHAQALPAAGDLVSAVKNIAGDAATVSSTFTADAVSIGLHDSATVINWKKFDIPSGKSIGFTDASGSTAPHSLSVLNRVVGNDDVTAGTFVIPQSVIRGQLTADSNISVYLINSSGILFGAGSVVNVGGLIASTQALSNGAFFNGPLHFEAQSGTGAGIEVEAGATLGATGDRSLGRSDLILIGASVKVDTTATGDTGATLTATGGDVGVVAAEDVTITSAPGSPLAMTIAKGTAIEGAFKVNGTLSGQNVTLALATRGAVTDTILAVDGLVTATGAAVTDRGVALTADRAIGGAVALSPGTAGDVGNAGRANVGAGVTSAAAIVAATAGNLTTSATLNTTGGKDITLTAGGTAAISGAVISGQKVTISASGTANVSGALAGGDDVSIGAGGSATASGGVTGGGTVSITATGAATASGSVTAASDYVVKGASITIGTGGSSATQSAARSVDLTATNGDITVLGTPTLQSNSADAAYSVLTNRALFLDAVNGAISLAGSTLLAGSGYSVEIRNNSADPSRIGAVTLGNVTAHGIATAGTIRIATQDTSTIFTGALTTGALTLAAADFSVAGSASIGGLHTLSGAASIRTTGAGHDLGIGAIAADTGGASITAAGALTLASLTASGAATLGGSAITTTGAITVGSLSATATNAISFAQAITTTIGSVGINSTASTLGVGSISAKTGVTLSAAGASGDVTAGGISTTSGDGTITAGRSASVNGIVTIGGDYAVNGNSVTLGGAQSATGAITIAAALSITSNNSGGSITPNSDGAGSEALTLRLTSTDPAVTPVLDLHTAADLAILAGGSAATALRIELPRADVAILLADVIAGRLQSRIGASGGWADGLTSTSTGGIRTGDITLTGGPLLLTAQNGKLDVGLLTAPSITLDIYQLLSSDILATAGSIAITGRGADIAAGTITAAGTSSDILVNANGGPEAFTASGLVAGRDVLIGQTNAFSNALTVSQPSSAGRDFRIASTGSVTVLTDLAAGRDAIVSAAGGVQFAGLTAGRAATLTASAGTAVIAGAVTVSGGNYQVTGQSVALGTAGMPLTQKASGTIAIQATGGTLTGRSGLTLQSDSNGLGNLALTLLTSGTTSGDIAFAGTNLLAGSSRQSNVQIGSRLATNTVALGDIFAANLLGASGGARFATGLTRTAAIGVGDIDIQGALALTATGNTLTAGALSGLSVALSSGASLSATAITAMAGAVTIGGSGALSVAGAITANGSAGDITINRPGALGVASLTAQRDLLIGPSSAAASVTVSGTAIAGRNISITSSGAQSYGGIVRGSGNATLNGSTLTLSGGVAATTGALSLTANSGNLTAQTLVAGTDASLTATNGTASVTGAISLPGNYSVTGASVILGTAGVDTLQQAGGTITITATGGTLAGLSGLTLHADTNGDGNQALTLATSGTSGGDVAFANTTLASGNATLGSPLQIRSRLATNTITLGSVTAGSLYGAVGAAAFTVGLTRNAPITIGDITLGMNALAGTDTSLRLNAGSGALTLGSLSTPGALVLAADGIAQIDGMSAGSATISGTGALTVNGAIASTGGITIDRAGAVRLASLSAQTDIAIGQTTAPSSIIIAGPVTSNAGAIAMKSSGSQTYAGALTSATATTLTAGGVATIAGPVVAGGAYQVTGASVVLGAGATPVVQRAASMLVTATAGSISGGSRLTLRGDAAGAGTGTLILDGAGGIALDAASRLESGAGGTGDIGIRAGAGQSIMLGSVTARRLTGATASHALATSLAATGALTFGGDVTTAQTLSATSTGPITTQTIQVTGAGQDLILSTTSGDFVALGALNASRNVTLGAAGLLSFSSAAATTGAASATAGATLTGTSLTGGTTVAATAGGALVLDTLSGQTGASGQGSSATLARANSVAGPLSLTAATGDLLIPTAISGGAVTLSAGCKVAINIASAGTGSDLTIASATTLGGMTPATRATLTAGRDIAVTANGQVLLTGAAAGRTITITGTTLDIPQLTATTGAATLTATTGSTRITSLAAQGDVTIRAAGAAAIDQGTSIIGGIDINSGGAVTSSRLSAATLLRTSGMTSSIGTVSGDRIDLTARNGAFVLGTGTAATSLRMIKQGSTGSLLVTGPLMVSAGSGDAVITSDTAITLPSLIVGRDAQLIAGSTIAIPLLTAGGTLAVTAGGATDLNQLTGNAVTVTAGGLATIAGQITAGSLAIQGAAVVLGTTGTAVSQTASGSVSVRATSGAISGRAGLVLTSDSDGDGSGDLILTATDGIGFAAGTGVVAGPLATATARISAGTGTALTLDHLTARTLVSFNPALTAPGFAQDGAVSIAQMTLRDATSISLTGAASALRLGDVTSASALSLATQSGLTANSLTAAGSLAINAGDATVSSISAGSLSATTTVGALDLAAVTTQGAATLAAATDLRLNGLDAVGSVSASAGGDIGGGAGGTSMAAQWRSRSGAISVSTLEDGDAGGAISFAGLTAATGLSLTGRQIVVGTATSDAGAIMMAARERGGAATSVSLTATTIDSGGSITLSSGIGSGAPISATNDAVRLGTATSHDGALTVTALDGTLTGINADNPKLTAAGVTGDIVVTTGGLAAIGNAAAARDLTIRSGDAAVAGRSGRIAIGSMAVGRALTLLTYNAAATNLAGIAAGQAAAGGDATIRASGAPSPVVLGPLDAAGMTTLASSGNLTLSSPIATSGSLAISAAGTLDAAEIVTGGGLAVTVGTARLALVRAAGDIGVTAGTIVAGDLASSGGAIMLTASTGSVALTTGSAATDFSVTTPVAASIGTVHAGGTLTIAASTLSLANGSAGTAALTATGPVSLGNFALTRGGGIIDSGDALDIGTISASGDATTASIDMSGARTAAATGATLIRGLTLTARTITAGSIGTNGALVATASAGNLRLDSLAASSASLSATGAVSVSDAATIAGDYAIRATAITLGHATGSPVLQAASGAVTLVATSGAIVGNAGLTLSSGAGGAKLTATGAGGAVTFAPATTINGGGAGDVAIDTSGVAALGTVTNSGRAITISATDLTLAGSVTGGSITLTNRNPAALTRLGDAPADAAAEFAATDPHFDLSAAEIARLSAARLVIDAQTGAVRVGDLALAQAAGTTLFQIRTTGRMDMLGRFTAAGSPLARMIVLGGSADDATRASVLRVAATAAGGGRLIAEGATLDLRADTIGVGLDGGFLDAIGLKSGTPATASDVASRYISQPNSSLYNATLGNAAGLYSDPVTVQAGRLIARYANFALFQNTATPGTQTGLVIGSDAQPQALQLTAAPGTNAFAMFGTINGIGSSATSLLSGATLVVGNQVSRANSRANGCLIGAAGGGCLSASIVQPTLSVFDSSRADVFRTGDDLTLPFDPLVGTSNEALFSDIASAAAIGADIPLTSLPPVPGQ